MTRRKDDDAALPPRDPPAAPDSECLGSYPSLAAFARDVLTPLLRAEGLWLLECLDLPRVLRHLAGGDRLRLHDGRVYLDRPPAIASGDLDRLSGGAQRRSKRPTRGGPHGGVPPRSPRAGPSTGRK